MAMDMLEEIFISSAVLRPGWENRDLRMRLKEKQDSVSALLRDQGCQRGANVWVCQLQSGEKPRKFSTGPAAPLDVRRIFQLLKYFPLGANPRALRIRSSFSTHFSSDFSKHTCSYTCKDVCGRVFYKQGPQINALKEFRTKQSPSISCCSSAYIEPRKERLTIPGQTKAFGFGS